MPPLPQQKAMICSLNTSLLSGCCTHTCACTCTHTHMHAPLRSIGNNSLNDYTVNRGREKCFKFKKKMFHVVDQKLTHKILQHLYQPSLWLWLQPYIITSHFHFIYFSRAQRLLFQLKTGQDISLIIRGEWRKYDDGVDL